MITHRHVTTLGWVERCSGMDDRPSGVLSPHQAPKVEKASRSYSCSVWSLVSVYWTLIECGLPMFVVSWTGNPPPLPWEIDPANKVRLSRSTSARLLVLHTQQDESSAYLRDHRISSLSYHCTSIVTDTASSSTNPIGQSMCAPPPALLVYSSRHRELGNALHDHGGQDIKTACKLCFCFVPLCRGGEASFSCTI